MEKLISTMFHNIERNRDILYYIAEKTLILNGKLFHRNSDILAATNTIRIFNLTVRIFAKETL